MPINQILLVGHTHHDVGYTNSPRIIDGMHARIVDQVLDLAELHRGDGPDAFRWTFEVARPVISFLRTASPPDRGRLQALSAAGVVAVAGGYLNMTQLPSAFELDAAYELLDEIRSAGIPVRTQQHGDVNGLSWGSVDQMQDAGIHRLVMALNPDHGRPPLTQPSGFWWEGPSGRRVFVWLSTHYGLGEEWGIVDGDIALAEERIEEFVATLQTRADYPFSTALVHAANDNRWPTARFLDVVRSWNARHPGVPMRTATIDEAMDVLEREALQVRVPVLRGEWADWWSHGHGSTAREVAVYREARSFARAARSTLALAALAGEGSVPFFDVLGYRRGPVRLRSDEEAAVTFRHVDEQLLLYGEHTWGSWETYSKPHSTFSHSHHNAKSAFAYDAFDHARDLAIEGWFRYVHAARRGVQPEPLSGEDALVVVNSTEAHRREIVDVEVAGGHRVRAIADVAPFAVAVLPVPKAGEWREVSGPIDAGGYRLTVDPARGGIVSLVEVAGGRELVDPDAGFALGAVVDEVVEPGSTHPMLVESPKLFRPDHPGPRFGHLAAVGEGRARMRRVGDVTQVAWDAAAPGVPEVTTTVSIADDAPDVDVDVWLSKPERFEPESVFVAFPFLVREPEFLVETAGAVFAAEREQLPDTSKDWYSIQHAVGVRGADDGVLWGSFDAPLVQLGGFHTGQWARQLEVAGGGVHSWLMNNLHFTNFQARQEITRRFRYRFRPVADLSAARVRRFGRDLLEPLQARHVPAGSVPEPGDAPLLVDPTDDLLVELRPWHGRVRARLRNLGDLPVEARLRTAAASAVQTRIVPALGVVDILLDP